MQSSYYRVWALLAETLSFPRVPHGSPCPRVPQTLSGASPPRFSTGFLPTCLTRLAILPPHKLAPCNLEAAQTGLAQLKPKPDTANRHPDRAQSNTCSPSIGIIGIEFFVPVLKPVELV